jgi:hypothetical protein
MKIQHQLSFFAALLSILCIAGCEKELVPFCMAPDMKGTWDANYSRLVIGPGPNPDTLENISSQFQMTFLDDHEGYYDYGGDFNWYIQCRPNALMISKVTSSSGDFYSTIIHPYLTPDSPDTLRMLYHYLESGMSTFRFTRVNFKLTRE